MTTPNHELGLNIKRLQVAKVMCLKTLLFSTRYFFKELNHTPFVVGDPHRIIAHALERVVTGKCKRLIINIAPRYGKTELAVIRFIAYCLSLNAAAKFIHLSYSDDLALDNSERIKDIVQSEPYQLLFPHVQVKRDSKAKNKWYTTEGGGVLARAAGGSVTGFGAGKTDGELTPEMLAELQRMEDEEDKQEFDEFFESDKKANDDWDEKFEFGGAIIIDDPIKPEDADSETMRERVNSRFNSTIRNRVNSRNTPIILIQQRLHPNDLAGFLQRKDEEDDWEVISLPSINQKALPVPGAKNEDGSQRSLVIGEALLSWKHTLSELKKKEKSDPLVFGRQHMQDPSPKAGLLFPLQELRLFAFETMREQLEDPDFAYVCTDPANLGGDDFATGIFKLIGNRIYLTDVIYNTDGEDHNKPRVVRLVLGNRVGAVGVEGIIAWHETAKEIRKELEDKDYQGEFRVLRPRTSKHSRILNRSSFIRNNFYFRDDYEDFPEYAKFMRVLTGYARIQPPGGKPKDDAPDLCEMAGVYYQRNHSHLWENTE